MLRGRLSKTTLAAAVCVGATAWLSLGILAVTDVDRARRIGVLPPLWLLAALVVAAIAIVAAIRLSARTSLPLFLSLLIALPWLPLRVPELLLTWTGHAVLLVWGAIALALATLTRSWRSWRTSQRFAPAADPRTAPRIAALLAWVIFLGVWTGQTLPPNGDEPHYLVIVQSLLFDRDVKVANNYERGDYLSYYGGFLRPHFSRPGVDGEQYSWHAPGLPVLVAPAFALGGYHAVVFWIAALAAIGTALVWAAGYLLTGDAGAAWFGWAVVALTAPVVLHGALVYPDPIAGVVLAAGALALVAASRHKPSNQAGRGHDTPWPAWASLVLGTAIGTLPWLHTRLALPAGILGLLLTLHIVADCGFSAHRWRHLALFAAPSVLLVAGWLAFFRIIYGTFYPGVAFGDRNPLDVGLMSSGLVALMSDQEFGLLPNAPVHLLWLVGLWSVIKQNARLGVELLLVAAPYAMASSAYPTWWAGSSSPARFLVPIVFPLGVAVACAWAQQGARARAISATLLGASVMIATVFAFGGDGSLAYNAASGRARWLDWAAPLVDLPRGFPSFFRATAGSVGQPALSAALSAELLRPALFWAAALAIGWVLFIVVDKVFCATRSLRALTAPACLVAVCAIGTTAVWRAAGEGHLTSTRAQLELLRGASPAWRPLGEQLVPLRFMPAPEVAARLAITTAPFDSVAPGTLLYLEEVPAGEYLLRVTHKPSARGELALGIGRATEPAAHWSVSAESARHFLLPISLAVFLPVRAASISVTGDVEAVQSIEKVALVPNPPLVNDHEPAAHSGTALNLLPADAGRARDAARYGPLTVYTVDDRVWLEPQGFWVMGERQPQVVIAMDRPAGAVELNLRNGPGLNRLRMRSGSWSSERALGPNESWQVSVPVAGAARAIVVQFDVERGFIPADVDPNSGDRRLLGCWVEAR